MFAIGIALSGFLGALPGEGGGVHAESVVVWLALWAAAAGVLAAAFVGGALAWLPPLTWAGLLLGVAGAWPEPLRGVAACLALYAAGFALGRGWPGLAWSWAGGLLLLAGLLAAAPSLGGALALPLPPEWTARLLDLSPVVWVYECAGGDWMRHPAVYDRAGGGDLSPDLRMPFGGWGSVAFGLLLAGTAAVLAGRSRRGRSRRRSPSA